MASGPDQEKEWRDLDKKYGPLKGFQQAQVQTVNQDWDKGPVFEPKKPEPECNGLKQSALGQGTAFGNATIHDGTDDALVGYSSEGGRLIFEHKASGKNATVEGPGHCILDSSGVRCYQQ